MYASGRDRRRSFVSRCGTGMIALMIVATPGVLVRPNPTSAQQRDPSQPGPLEYISRGDSRVIRKQVEIAIKAAEMAVETLGRGAEADNLTRAKDLAAKSYVLLRYALHGVELVANDEQRLASEKLLARMAVTAINQAREHNLSAQRAIDKSIPVSDAREQYVEEAIQDLTDSIPSARRAAMLLLR